MVQAPDGRRHGFVMECTASTSELKDVRSALRDWLWRVGRPVGDWDVVVTELLCNAINATSQDSLNLEMQIESNENGAGQITCTVTNEGEWDLDGLSTPAAIDYVVARSNRPEDYLPTGRGLRMVCALISGGTVSVHHGCTTVKVWLEAPAFDPTLNNT